MIPAQFDYVAPTTVEEALAALAEGGEDAKVIAGGQSLLPVLRMRLNAPDRRRRPRQDRVAARGPRRRRRDRHRRDDHALRRAARPAGAGARRCCSPRRSSRSPTRRCGTAAPSGARSRTPTRPATSARRRSRSTRSSSSPGRAAPAPSRPTTSSSTCSPPRSEEGELLTEIRIPKRSGWGAHYEKFVRVAHQWPIVAVAAAVKVDGGTISRGPGRPDQHGLHAAAGPRGRGRRWSASRPPTRRYARPRRPRPRAPTRPRTSTATPTTGRHLATVLTRRAVLAAAGA